MKYLFFICLFLAPFVSNSQVILLDIPITKEDSVRDQSSHKHAVDYYHSTYNFRFDEAGQDSSALYLGMREWFEVVNTENFENLDIEDVTFSIKVKFIQESLPSSRIATLFGQNQNIGLIFDYSDSTIKDMDGLLSCKLNNINSWHHIELRYESDQSIELYVDHELKASAQRGTVPSFNNQSLGVGIYLNSTWRPDYLYAVVDSVRMTTTGVALNTTIASKKLQSPIKEIIFYDLSGKSILKKELRENVMYIKVTRYEDGSIKKEKVIDHP